MKHAQVNVPAVVVSIASAALVLVAMVVIGDSYSTSVELQQMKMSPSLEREIQKLRSKLDLPAQPSTTEPVAVHGNAVKTQQMEEAVAGPPTPPFDITKPLLPETAHARAVGAWARSNDEQWFPEQQRRYDKAVAHAQVVEKHSQAVFQPLRLEKGYLHEAEDEENEFEEQIIGLARILEPSYISEAVRWAESGEKDENAVLEPFVEAIERPLVKDLELEAQIRVDKAVDAIAAKEMLSLPEKEQLRAHLMAPLMMRIRTRVHSHVAQYVNSMARQLVLKAVNATNPHNQEHVSSSRGWGGVETEPAVVPELSDDDVRMIHALHDLEEVYKDKVISEKDYETQRAKLLSDWLKHAVNKAGGNAEEVLRIVFGGEVRGVTTTGIKDESPIDVHKKLEMEKGIASMQEDRQTRLNKDLVAQLVKGKTQWGAVSGCDGKWDTPKCETKWKEIESLVESVAGSKDEEPIKFNKAALDHEVKAKTSKGTHRLFEHIDSPTDKIWHVAKGHASSGLKAVDTAQKHDAGDHSPVDKHWYCLYLC